MATVYCATCSNCGYAVITPNPASTGAKALGFANVAGTTPGTTDPNTGQQNNRCPNCMNGTFAAHTITTAT